MLEKLYLRSRNRPWLYRVYLLLRLPSILPGLVSNEGIFGALRWLRCRIQFLRGREIAEFDSRFGFRISRMIEFAVYDEIFLQRVYDFKALGVVLGKGPVRVIDFGAHHGLFIDFVRWRNPNTEVFAAEMNPGPCQCAKSRFASRPDTHIVNVAIGGWDRKAHVSAATVSTEQSLYGGEGSIEVQVVTPVEFAQTQGIGGLETALVKMDIEGAEHEVFERPEVIKPLLDMTRGVVMEIHTPEDVVMITDKLRAWGFELSEIRGTNRLYVKKSLMK